ncbi:3-hydroxyacyl-CoA dehydrogenase NAD-binding domain-containing protein [Sedimentitalea sp.]|uniref:3-hydroxyacyl-CoA dehydrogenase NAD-binding domain-containing protein n=1 Tax=Sedimentitalea sp. TaxID=2048915 RepID=UPI00329957D3
MKDKIEAIVEIETEGEIGLIRLAKPPVNALGVALRTAVYEAYNTLSNDPGIRAIVLYDEGRFFSAGADINDFGKADIEPTLPQVLKSLNNSKKPVIAALHGVAFGGALEMALACHLRVGATGLRVGLPEVKLGLLPGAGGAQRLPRLTGLARAIDIICSGRDVPAKEALATGILDRLFDAPVRDAGISAARDALTGTLEPKRTDALVVSEDPGAAKAARIGLQAKRPALRAPLKALEAVCSATLPIEQGLAKERALFMELMAGEERAGLVHAFFAERATGRIPERDAESRTIKKVAVIGGGTMGVGIATTLLIEAQAARIETARNGVVANLGGALSRGKLSDEGHAAALGRLECTDVLEKVAEADLVIEAIFEDITAKTMLFNKLDVVCKSGAILATNTSYLDVNEIAAATNRPEDVIGLHFFSPAHVMRLVEIVVAKKTAPECVATAFALVCKLGKVPVRAVVCDGFIGNRILTQYRRAADYLLLDGASFTEIDAALEEFGFAMGPFSVSDLAGLDIAKATRDRKTAARPSDERYSNVADLICDAGCFGRKAGQGYYLYETGKKVAPNPGAERIVEAERRKLGLTPRTFDRDEIVARCLTAMIAEAVRVQQDGIALHPVDIDAVELFGYGFPRHRGGPMHQADLIGPTKLIRQIESYATEDPQFWQVPALLRDMQCEGRSFADLND